MIRIAFVLLALLTLVGPADAQYGPWRPVPRGYRPVRPAYSPPRAVWVYPWTATQVENAYLQSLNRTWTWMGPTTIEVGPLPFDPRQHLRR